MVIKVDNSTLRKRAQSKRGSTTYSPGAKEIAEAVRNTPGVRKNMTPRTIFNLPSELMAIIDPTGNVHRYAARVPNLRHVPKKIPSRRGPVRLTGNQAARRIQRGARNTINKGLAKRLDNVLWPFWGLGVAGRASPARGTRYNNAIEDYLRKNPAPTNRNISAAVNIAARFTQPPSFGIFTSHQQRLEQRQRREKAENYIAQVIETYRPFLAATSPQRSTSSRRTRPSRKTKSPILNSSSNGSLNSM